MHGKLFLKILGETPAHGNIHIDGNFPAIRCPHNTGGRKCRCLALLIKLLGAQRKRAVPVCGFRQKIFFYNSKRQPLYGKGLQRWSGKQFKQQNCSELNVSVLSQFADGCSNPKSRAPFPYILPLPNSRLKMERTGKRMRCLT